MNDDHPQPKQLAGKGFAKGDPRINRLGRPKHFDQFRKLAQRISHEKVIGPDGNTITRAELLLRSWAKSKQPALQLAFAAYCWGKTPEKVEVDELQPKTRLILHFGHELDDNGQLRPPRVPLPPDEDGVHRQWRRSDDDGAPNGEGTLRLRLPDATT